VRVLVTGAAGLLGAEVVAALTPVHEVIGADLAEFDVTDLAATTRAFRDARPDAIVHCAAFADVDGAEAREIEAFRVNAIGARNAALAANNTHARLLHISTDYVFDGRATRPYIESDTPNPLGVYGRSKWMGELFVRELARDFIVVRTQALYGVRGASFPRAILARLDRGEPLRVVNDQTVCPTRAADLARALVLLLEKGAPGVYHASSRGECTWYDFAREILRLRGRPAHPLVPVSTTEFARPAPRPAYSVLRNLHLELTIGDPMPHWTEAIALHFREHP
jgi:dTDP-4-dehydrorhamnose reductase